MMIEPKFPMDEGLDRFEQDLKSLTPKRFPKELPARDPNWLKIASISWLMGLAAGVLVSAIWTKLMNGEVPIAEPNQVTQKVALSPNSPTTTPFGSRQPGVFRDGLLVGSSRFIATDLDDDYVLQPLMRRNTVNGSRRFSGEASHTSREDSATPNANSFPKYQGQRQLLKMLMESDDLISI